MRTLRRAEIIDQLRRALLTLTSEDESLCAVAGRLGVFCRGHQRMSDEELASTYDWIVARQRPADRAELEALANKWQLARQAANDLPLACDVQTAERETCCGWDSFSDEELAGYYRELTSESVRVEETVLVRIRAR